MARYFKTCFLLSAAMGILLSSLGLFAVLIGVPLVASVGVLAIAVFSYYGEQAPSAKAPLRMGRNSCRVQRG
jgi:hypothetical protein